MKKITRVHSISKANLSARDATLAFLDTWLLIVIFLCVSNALLYAAVHCSPLFAVFQMRKAIALVLWSANLVSLTFALCFIP